MKPHSIRPGTTVKSNQGLALIELMIALLLGAFLTIGLIQIFSSNNQAYRLNQASSRVQESGRISVDIVSREIRNAGYFGCSSAGSATNNLDQTGTGYDANLHNIRTSAVFGDDASRPDNAIGDFIGVSGGRSEGVSVTSTGPATSATIQVSSIGNLEDGDIIMITDCGGSDIFQINNISSGGGNITIVGNSGSGSPGNDFLAAGGSCVNCLSKSYQSGAQVIKAYNEYYFVAPGTSGINSLFWQNSSGAAIELVEGIEAMAVRFSSDGGSSWEARTAVTNWDNVNTVEISFLVRSVSPHRLEEAREVCFPYWLSNCQSYDELYRTYSSTVALRN